MQLRKEAEEKVQVDTTNLHQIDTNTTLISSTKLVNSEELEYIKDCKLKKKDIKYLIAFALSTTKTTSSDFDNTNIVGISWGLVCLNFSYEKQTNVEFIHSRSVKIDKKEKLIKVLNEVSYMLSILILISIDISKNLSSFYLSNNTK